VVRRLPPGMTKDEFVSILGPAWEVSKGKVDWFCYVAGKISTEYVKSHSCFF
jgi:regulator of nonsense transcripts 3